MGYIAHHAVVVVMAGWMKGRPEWPDLDAFRESLPEKWRPLVVGPVKGVVNDDYSAVFLPDHSKEGWADSDSGDDYRQQFIDLFNFVYDDGSIPFDVALIRFGGDEPRLATLDQPNFDPESECHRSISGGLVG